MTERLSDRLRAFLTTAEGRDVTLRQIRDELRVVPGSTAWDAIRTYMYRLDEERIVKKSGRNDGSYRVLIPVEPVRFTLDGDDSEGVLDFKFPRSYIDDTTFGLENLIEVSAGDLILITGATNFGKTAIALSILGRNLGLFPTSLLMGSEYTSSSGKISPKLKRRLRRMDWAQWMNGDGPRFKLLPVESEYEDYVAKDGLTVIDWISLPGEYYLIDRVMKDIKNRAGDGVVVPVLQMNSGAEFAEGGQRTERYADCVLQVDRYGTYESKLTIGKVKSAKVGRVSGRTFAFGIANYGANLENIREIVRCGKCWGKGWLRAGQSSKPCFDCRRTGYVDKPVDTETDCEIE